MYILQKLTQLIGINQTSYLLIIITILLLQFGLTNGNQFYGINFTIVGLYRGFAGILVNYFISRNNQIQAYYRTSKDFKLLVIRNILISLQGVGYSISLRYLQQPIVFTISNTGPIIIFIMQHYKNNLKIDKKQVNYIIISFLGIILTVNSNLIMYYFGYQQFQSKFNYQNTSTYVKVIIAFLFFLIIVAWSYAIILTKQINVGTIQMGLHLAYTIFFSNAILIFIFPPSQQINFSESFWIFVLVGFPLGVLSLFYIKGMQMTKKIGICSMMQFLMVIFSYCLSIFRYNQKANIFGISGSVFIFLGVYFLSKQK